MSCRFIPPRGEDVVNPTFRSLEDDVGFTTRGLTPIKPIAECQYIKPQAD